MTQFDQRYQHVETQYNAEQITIQQQPISLTEKQRKQNRTRMLDRVKAIWIEGVLESSVQGAAQIALELESKPSAVVTPLWSVLREFDKTGPLSSADASIVQVYDHANGEVLILGEPGAGKTTLLLELTRALLERARQDQDGTSPLPVVFPLSSWAVKRQPFDEWLVVALHLRYQIPFPLAAEWIKTDQVLPLLDGLDEVAAPLRAACVEAINTYRQAHGLLPTVVCSRQTDYFALPTRLLLRTAVVVQPLTAEQIMSYLASGGERLEALQLTLQEDADLQALASTPLMLNVLTAAYQGPMRQEIDATGSLGMKQERVFALYVQRMLTRRSASTRYTPQQTIHWCSSLASQVKRQSQTVFYIEHMQPDWLGDHRRHQMYEYLAVRLPAIFIGMLVSLLILNFFVGSVYGFPLQLIYAIFGGLVGGLLGREPPHQIKGFWRGLFTGKHLLSGCIVGLSYGLIYGITYELRIGLIYGSIFGLVSGGLGVILEKKKQVLRPMETDNWSWRNAWRNFVNVRYLENGSIVGVSYALGYVLSTEVTHQLHTNQSNVLAYALFYVVNYTLIGILLTMILEGRTSLIQPAEIIVWSWGRIWRSLVDVSRIGKGLGIGLLVGGLGGLSVWLRNDPNVRILFVLNAALIFGLAYWLLLGITNGLSSTTLDEQHRLSPNQGIRHSTYNGIVVGCVSGIICWGVCSLGYTLSYTLQYGIYYGVLVVGPKIAISVGFVFGLTSGLLCGLLNGGLASIQHYILRFLVVQAGIVPWSYPRFLDYAHECILLRKVGGGYMFIHRLLLDYFASLQRT